MTSSELVKVIFALERNAWHGSATESLWAERVDDRRFRLRNAPFYAHGVSAEDIVIAEERDDEFWFSHVMLRGGHSTYRLFVKKETSAQDFERYWRPLQKLGCAYEEGPVLAVDVPARANIQKAYEQFAAGYRACVWDFEEGHCGHCP